MLRRLPQRRFHVSSFRFQSQQTASQRIRGQAAVKNTSMHLPSDAELVVTSRAISRLHDLNTKFKSNDYLRVAVDSGGCHGFQYTFQLTPKPNPDDLLFDAGDTSKVLVDAISYPFLAGAEIDYAEEIIGSAFKVASNPNASSECGCKISFQAK